MANHLSTCLTLKAYSSNSSALAYFIEALYASVSLLSRGSLSSDLTFTGSMINVFSQLILIRWETEILIYLYMEIKFFYACIIAQVLVLRSYFEAQSNKIHIYICANVSPRFSDEFQNVGENL